jgi:hypothetical protein
MSDETPAWRSMLDAVTATVRFSAVVALTVPALPIAVYAVSRLMAALPKEAHKDLAHRFLEAVRGFQGAFIHNLDSRCHDCSRHGTGYMVRHEVWDAALSEKERERTESLLLCLACVSKRLGRMLTPTDFDPKFRINWPIFCAFQIAGGDSKLDFSMMEAMFDEAEELHDPPAPADTEGG